MPNLFQKMQEARHHIFIFLASASASTVAHYNHLSSSSSSGGRWKATSLDYVAIIY